MKSRLSLSLSLLKAGGDPSQIIMKLALRKALSGCENVLDVGCGAAANMRQLGVQHCVGIDGYQPDVEKARKQNTQDEIFLGDVRELSRYFRPGQFDACVALDVIEHLTKEDGIKLMREMEKMATKKVVFFTPSGFLPQRQSANDDLQAHLSGWEAEEMRRLGYDVIGMLGPKTLRGEYHALKKKPAVFWGIVSVLGQIFSSKNHPEKAAAILCVKTLGRS